MYIGVGHVDEEWLVPDLPDEFDRRIGDGLAKQRLIRAIGDVCDHAIVPDDRQGRSGFFGYRVKIRSVIENLLT